MVKSKQMVKKRSRQRRQIKRLKHQNQKTSNTSGDTNNITSDISQMTISSERNTDRDLPTMSDYEKIPSAERIISEMSASDSDSAETSKLEVCTEMSARAKLKKYTTNIQLSYCNDEYRNIPMDDPLIAGFIKWRALHKMTKHLEGNARFYKY